MRALGVKLLKHGDDFSTAREFAKKMDGEQSLQMVDPFDRLLVAGVATQSLELLRAVKDHDVAYVIIGLGSGICGMLVERGALNLKTKIV
jgi:threonine dehydratase